MKRKIFGNQYDGSEDNQEVKSSRKWSDQVNNNNNKVSFLDLLQNNNNLIVRSGSPLKNNKEPVKPK